MSDVQPGRCANKTTAAAVLGEFFFNAKTQHENLGDAIISRELLNLLDDYGIIHVLAQNDTPEDFLELIEAHRRTCYQSPFQFIATLITKAFKSLWNRSFNKSKTSVYYVLNPGGFSGDLSSKGVVFQIALVLIYAFLWVLRVRVVRLGASAGPFSPGRAKIERIKSMFMYKNTVRDSLSMNYAKKIGLRHVEFFPDMAFMLKPITNSRITGVSLTEPYAVFSFRSESKYLHYDASIETVIQRCIQNISEMQGLDRVYASQVSYDRLRNRDLSNTLKNIEGDSYIVDDLASDDYLRLYRDARVVMSNRLHVLLFALRQGIPAFAVVDPQLNPKIVGIYEDLGCDDLIISITNPVIPQQLPDPHQFMKRTQEVFDSRSVQAHRDLPTMLNVST
ncbi:MAG: polysaccharide pyruvyl transferase family protein [Pseudomonadota bacterium]